MQVISLRCGGLRAEVLPEAGGALARFDLLRDGAVLPVLRPLKLGAGGAPPAPSQLACFPLLPWSNRIAPGGFLWEERLVAPAPNRAGEPCPIHGDAWQQSWQVLAQSAAGVVLTLDRRQGEPFSYQACLRYVLEQGALRVTLEVTNSGAHALPFGLGLHPWLPRGAQTMLRAPAGAVWRSGPDRLPKDKTAIPPHWDFSHWRSLPEEGVDNAFTGWNGQAEVRWPEAGLTLGIEADMAYYILYAPPGADFFCFEPVDHAINAHNLDGGAVRNGLTRLEPGKTLKRHVSFTVTQCTT